MLAEKNNQNFQIAIDGPVAAGKGTVAKMLARQLGFLYVDTGALYRVAALLAFRNDLMVTEDNVDQLVQLVNESEIELKNNPDPMGLILVYLNGKDVSEQIRTPEISRLVSQIAIFAKLRQAILLISQAMAQNNSVVMEGRDITYRTLPHADLKVFLTASVEARAHRRWQQQLTSGNDQPYEAVLEDLKERDYRDSTREVDPLKIMPDVLVVDTTELSIAEVVALLEEKWGHLRAQVASLH